MAPFSPVRTSERMSSPDTPGRRQYCSSRGNILLLTVWSFANLWVKCTGGLCTIVLLRLGRITTNNLMFLCEASCYSELVEPVLASQVLFSNPSTLNKIALAFLDAPAIRVVKMSLPPQDLPVGVPTWMCDDTSGQEDGGQSLRNLDHDD
jgi:hypothetical protein